MKEFNFKASNIVQTHTVNWQYKVRLQYASHTQLVSETVDESRGTLAKLELHKASSVAGRCDGCAMYRKDMIQLVKCNGLVL